MVKKNHARNLINAVISVIITFAVIATTALNADAASLKTAVFPVDNGVRIAFVYGNSKEYGGWHNGIDIHAGKNGDKVYCAVSGVVVGINNNCKHQDSYNRSSPDYKKCNHINSWGNSVYVRGEDGWYYIYGHLAKDSITVKQNDRVEAGTPIARIGSSGASTGKHLHFEVRKKLGSSSTAVNVNKNVVFKYVDGPYKGNNPVISSENIVNNNIYTISSAYNPGIVVTATGTANKSNVVLKPLNKNDKAQQWRAVKNGDWFYFVNLKSGKCLDVSTSSVSKAANNVNVWLYSKQTSKSTMPTQLFKVTYKTSGKNRYAQISLYNSKFGLDAAGSSPRSGSNLQIYKLTGGTSNLTQLWILKSV